MDSISCSWKDKNEGTECLNGCAKDTVIVRLNNGVKNPATECLKD